MIVYCYLYNFEILMVQAYYVLIYEMTIIYLLGKLLLIYLNYFRVKCFIFKDSDGSKIGYIYELTM